MQMSFGFIMDNGEPLKDLNLGKFTIRLENCSRSGGKN